jgi:hypothetical protein
VGRDVDGAVELLGGALAFSFATASSAAIMPAPVGLSSDLTIKVAE